MQYLNFDLKIERAGQGYTVEVDSPAGQAGARFDLPFSDLDVEKFLLRIGQSRRVVRRVDSPEVDAAKEFGARLFETVFSAEPRSCLRSSIDEATRQSKGLRIRLLLTEVPELADLPWEYLYNPALNRFLTLSARTPIVRYLEIPERIRPLTVTPPLRVLALIASPKNYVPLDVEREWNKLRTALADLERRGLVVLERLDPVTLAALQQQLRRGKYHILHFVGHGGFDEQRQGGVLLLEDDQHYGHRVSGEDLGTLVYDHDPLRLAVLNACEGGRSSRSDPFAGVAQSLIQQGTPAVIAMQFEVTDESAIAIAQGFYGAIADGYPVDAALAEARRTVFVQSAGVEWGTPVLYMRAEDGRIFDITRTSEGPASASAAPDELMQRWQQARTAAFNEEWEHAEQLLVSIVERNPNYQDVQAQLAEVRRQRQIQALHRQLQQHRAANQWQGVLDIFDQLKRLSPDELDPDGLRRWAEVRRYREQQYAAALVARDRRDWEEAIATLEALVAIIPDDADAHDLLESIRVERRAAAPRTVGQPAAQPRRIPVAGSLVLLVWVATLIAAVASGVSIANVIGGPRAPVQPPPPTPRFHILPVAGEPTIAQLFGTTRWATSMGSGLYAATRGRHPGIDFAAPDGSAVLALDNGTVLCVGPTCAFGRVKPIVVRYGDVYAVYSHVTQVLVASGQAVQPGTELGRSGGMLTLEVLPIPPGAPGSQDPNQLLISPGLAVNPIDYFSVDLMPYFERQYEQLGRDSHFCRGSFRDQPPVVFGGPADPRPCTRK